MEYGSDTREDLAALLVAALDALPTATIITDAHVVLFANGEARKLLKCANGSTLEGRLVSDLVHPDGLETSRMRGEILARSSATLHGLPVKLVALDGSTVSLMVAGTPLDLGDQRVFMFTSEQ